jgi:hypothetical protein
VAEPLRAPSPVDDEPAFDPRAIERAYRRERARRQARIERRRSAKRAHVRFWITMLFLVFAAAFGVVAAWNEVRVLFGI